jgi:hypothetical protein
MKYASMFFATIDKQWQNTANVLKQQKKKRDCQPPQKLQLSFF